LSRMYLGLHWPVDVMGAIVLGTLSVLLADYAFEFADQKGIKWLNLLLLIPVVAAVVIWQDSDDFVKSAATISGFLIGYSLETNFIQFDVKAPAWKQVLKFILGIVVVLVLKEGLKQLFPQAPIFDFLRYLILGLWITVGAPLVFHLFKLSDRYSATR